MKALKLAGWQSEKNALYLWWMGFSREVCALLPGLKLSQLTLPGRHSVTDSSLLLLSRLSLLLELDLTDYTQVTDQGVSHLSSMTRSSPHFWTFYCAVVFVWLPQGCRRVCCAHFVQVEEAVTQQHSADRCRASVSAWPAGDAGALFGPNSSH